MRHFIRWLIRTRYCWRAWRARRHERSQNAIIATQAEQIRNQSKAWLHEVDGLQQENRKLKDDQRREREELAARIEVLTLKNDMLEELAARERSRLAFEAAHFARGVSELQNLPGQIVT